MLRISRGMIALEIFRTNIGGILLLQSSVVEQLLLSCYVTSRVMIALEVFRTNREESCFTISVSEKCLQFTKHPSDLYYSVYLPIAFEVRTFIQITDGESWKLAPPNPFCAILNGTHKTFVPIANCAPENNLSGNVDTISPKFSLLKLEVNIIMQGRIFIPI